MLEDINNCDGMRGMKRIPDLETGEKSGSLVIRNITDTVLISLHQYCRNESTTSLCSWNSWRWKDIHLMTDSNGFEK